MFDTDDCARIQSTTFLDYKNLKRYYYNKICSVNRRDSVADSNYFETKLKNAWEEKTREGEIPLVKKKTVEIFLLEKDISYDINLLIEIVV